MTSKCRGQPKKGASNTFLVNTKGSKKIWVPKKKLIPIVDVLDSRKQMSIMVPGQWLLTVHDRRKVYAPMHDSLSWWNHHFQRQ